MQKYTNFIHCQIYGFHVYMAILDIFHCIFTTCVKSAKGFQVKYVSLHKVHSVQKCLVQSI